MYKEKDPYVKFRRCRMCKEVIHIDSLFSKSTCLSCRNLVDVYNSNKLEKKLIKHNSEKLKVKINEQIEKHELNSLRIEIKNEYKSLLKIVNIKLKKLRFLEKEKIKLQKKIELLKILYLRQKMFLKKGFKKAPKKYGNFLVSKNGDIVDFTRIQIPKKRIVKNAGYHISIHSGTKSVAHIVLETFGKRRIPKNAVILRKNGISTDDRLQNLSWIKIGDLIRLRNQGKKRGAVKYNYRGHNYWASMIFYKGKSHTIGFFKSKKLAYIAFYKEFKKVHGYTPW